jgi:two-component system response regulator DegU
VQPATNNRRLSAREAEVLRLFAEGALPLQVAQQLYVSPKTVKNHLSHIYAKLGAVNRTQAVALAVKQGVFPFSDLLQ